MEKKIHKQENKLLKKNILGIKEGKQSFYLNVIKHYTCG